MSGHPFYFVTGWQAELVALVGHTNGWFLVDTCHPGRIGRCPRPISLLDTIGKLFGNILLTRILCEVSGRWLLRNEQFGFRPKHSTALQLANLVEIVSGNFDEKRLTDAVLLDVAKAFDIVWVDCLLNKLTLSNFPSYLVKTICSSPHGRTFEVSFQRAPSIYRFMRTGVAEGGIMFPGPI
jgi:hypothetical protein